MRGHHSASSEPIISPSKTVAQQRAIYYWIYDLFDF